MVAGGGVGGRNDGVARQKRCDWSETYSLRRTGFDLPPPDRPPAIAQHHTNSNSLLLHHDMYNKV
jgi:hypothetical protein